ncbi:hypothetical protein SCH01S_03_00070 [Sphingomonas changbaiensis NBRC 104936]|uniref:Uncharacterized protein n=2 Tax=Sphingomonas changbaiensis TaxID=529705 RepID=A0A0E9MKK0_9SPHN|nr:hypothetical protein SCH01S_03_00070 [Sphingomonas changbaiensis NBRC 104936]
MFNFVPGGAHMTRLVRDFFEVEDQVSLDHMIDLLSAVRDRLPEGAEDAKVRMCGDDVFGRRLTVSYLRPQTADEAARDARYHGGQLSIAA